MKLFELLGVITVNNQDANNKISETTEKTEGLHSTLLNGMETAGKWAIKFAAAAATAAAATAAALTKIVTSNVAAMDAIDKGSQRLGMTTKSYQEWSYVMGQCGLNMEQMESGMMALTNKMEEAADPNSEAAKAFRTLGVAAYDSEGNLRNVNDVFEETVAAMTKMENESEKLALADMLFAGSGQLMMPMLNKSYADIVALKKEANDLGLILTDEEIAAAVKFADTSNTLKSTYGTIGTEIASTLLPALESFYEFLLNKFPTIKKEFVEGFLPELEKVVSGVFGIIQALLDPDGEMKLEESINKIVDGIVSIVGRLAEHAPVLVEGLCKLFEALLPHVGTLIDALLPLVTAILGGIMEKIPELAGAVGGAVSDNADSFLTLLLGASAIKGGKSLFGKLFSSAGGAAAGAAGSAAAGAGGSAVVGAGTRLLSRIAGFTPLNVLGSVWAVAAAADAYTDKQTRKKNEHNRSVVDAFKTDDPVLAELRKNMDNYYADIGNDTYAPVALSRFMYAQYADVDENGNFIGWNQDKVNATNKALAANGYDWNLFKPFDPDAYGYKFDEADTLKHIDNIAEMFENMDLPGKDGASVMDALSAITGKSGTIDIMGSNISQMITVLSSVSAKLDTVINQQAQGKTVVLNTGALVGGIGNAMDKYLGNTVNNKARGMA